MYNFSEINASSVVTFTQSVNTVFMDGWLGTLWLIVIFMVLFLGSFVATNNLNKSAGAASFFTFLGAVLLRAIDLVPNITLFVTLILLAIVVVGGFATTKD